MKKSPKFQSAFMTDGELAKMLHVSRSTITRAVQGRYPSLNLSKCPRLQLGRHRRWHRDDVAEFLKDAGRASAAHATAGLRPSAPEASETGLQPSSGTGVPETVAAEASRGGVPPSATALQEEAVNER